MHSTLPAGAVRRNLTDADVQLIGQHQEQGDEPEALFAGPSRDQRSTQSRIHAVRRERFDATSGIGVELPNAWQAVRESMTLIRRGGYTTAKASEVRDAALQAVLNEYPSTRSTIDSGLRATRSRSVDRDGVDLELSRAI
jgi:hypothetical protein